MRNRQETDLGAMRMYIDEDGHILFSPPVKALKWTTVFSEADNKHSRQAFALMLAAECEERTAVNV